MATLQRNTKMASTYRDYTNFLESYKNGNHKDDQGSNHSEDSGISRGFSNKEYSSRSTSSSSINSDVTDCAKGNNGCVSFKTYQENRMNKKFSSVKVLNNKKDDEQDANKEKPALKRSEIFIEIQGTNHVSETSKMFEPQKQDDTTIQNNNKKIGETIKLFEGQKTKLPTSPKPPIQNHKPTFIRNVTSPPLKSTQPPPPPPPQQKIEHQRQQPTLNHNDKSIQLRNEDSTPTKSTHPTQNGNNTNQSTPPPPPPPPPMPSLMVTQPKITATLKTHPQTKIIVETSGNPSGQLDKNDPAVKKLVYGTLRGLYGAYHDKANYIVATLPRNMVKKDNGIQRIINEMACNGDLEKLSGRANPKQE